MASGKQIKELEALARASLWDEFCDKVYELLDRQDGDPDGKVFALLDDAAGRSTEAALVAGMSYSRYSRPDAGGEARRHLLKAARSPNPRDAAMANLALARHLSSDERHWPEVAARMEEAAFMGNEEAMAAFGIIRIAGKMGLRANLDEGEMWLIQSSDRESPSGCYELAMHILNSGRNPYARNPIKLLMTAAELGHEPARKAIFEMGLLDEDAHDPMLPYPVVPAGSARATAIVDTLCNLFDVDPDEARELVAALHGYPDWNLMMEAAGDPAKKKGKFDEDCTADERSERERLQTSVVQHFLHLPSFIAEAVVEVVRPTASSGEVALEDFRRAVDRRRREMTADDVRGSMMTMMRGLFSGLDLGRKFK